MCESSETRTAKRATGLFLMAAVSIFSPTSAFTSFSPSVIQTTSSTSLNLKSGQGNQLVAACAAAACKKGGNHRHDDVVLEQKRTEAAPAHPEARSLAARLFSLDFNNHAKDEVVYPLVGFKLVHHEGRVIPLPTKSHASCRLKTRAQADEVPYGWFSPACDLDLYSEDICHKPEEETAAESS
ncbi:MAG: hypothetical protein SGBAC_005108 [Bacillariaceae sp.]